MNNILNNTKMKFGSTFIRNIILTKCIIIISLKMKTY